jgi:hypothetical protein
LIIEEDEDCSEIYFINDGKVGIGHSRIKI